MSMSPINNQFKKQYKNAFVCKTNKTSSDYKTLDYSVYSLYSELKHSRQFLVNNVIFKLGVQFFQ